MEKGSWLLVHNVLFYLDFYKFTFASLGDAKFSVQFTAFSDLLWSLLFQSFWDGNTQNAVFHVMSVITLFDYLCSQVNMFQINEAFVLNQETI